MLTLSREIGTGGEIKSEPEDFIVKEITSKGIVLEPGRKYTVGELGENEVPDGKFTTFVLEKKNWETMRAVLEIAKRAGRGRKSVSYAGTKDKRSISAQLACIFGIEPANLGAVRIKDISINGAWRSNELELGSNLGNAFVVNLKNAEHPDRIDAIIEELNGIFPNYFDRQRFGYRLNNAKIGMQLLQDNPEGAAMAFLTDTANEEDEEAREARKQLSEELDFKKALEYFPRHLRYERTMIDYLARYDNFANSIRKIPRGIAIMFIHAVEALIFNEVLEKRTEGKDFDTNIYCKGNFYGFPDLSSVTKEKGTFPIGTMVGYETKDEDIDGYGKDIMEKLGISKDSFKIKSMPELSMKGAYRQLFSPFKDFTKSINENVICLGFSIPTGAYATVFLNEITKSKGLEIKDIAPNF